MGYRQEALMGIATLLFAYLLGSVPFSPLVARIWAQVDLRHIGSGNPGGMNVIRETGWLPGIVAILLDLGKGLLPVLVAQELGQPSWVPPWAGAAAVTGHCYSLLLVAAYLRETGPGQAPRLPWWQAQPRLGGKGLATGIGALLAISLPTLLISVGVFATAALVLLWRGLRGSPVVARSATAALLIAAIALGFFERSWVALAAGVVMAIITLIKHVPYLALTSHWPTAQARQSPAQRQPNNSTTGEAATP